MNLIPGDIIPDFSLKDQNGNDFDIKSVKGKYKLVIYFYPKNFTPGCIKEACGFRDHYEDFKDLDVVVIGISSDSEISHSRFAENYDLPFTLLSDRDGRVRKEFGVKKNLLGLLPGRETYVIDASGKLIMKFNSINAQEHIKRALKALKS